MSNLRSLYVDINSFFASCEQQDRPELRGRPVAVVPMLADSTSVIAASYEAKAFGVKTGVKVRDAKRMCPGLVLIQARHGPYVRYHHQVIGAVDSVIPVRAVCSIDEIACELTGSQMPEDRARQIAAKVKSAIAERVGTSIKCSIGLSTNFLLAKIACDFQKPDGLTVLSPDNLVQRLSTLKLQDVPGIGSRMEARLWSGGVRTMAQLLQKNENEMRALWGGVLGARFFRLLRGDWIDLGAKTATKSIGHEHVLPPSERSLPEALLVAHKLLSKAATRLRDGGWMTRSLTLSVKFIGDDRFHDQCRIEETQDTSFLIRELNRMASALPAHRKILKIGISLGDFIEESQHQLSLFGSSANQNVFKAVDQINEKFGRDTIYVGTLHEKKKSAETRIAFSRIPGLEELD